MNSDNLDLLHHLVIDLTDHLRLHQQRGHDSLSPAEAHEITETLDGMLQRLTRRPAQSPIGKADRLEEVRQRLGECTRCDLSRRRKTIVFGQGNPQAELMFIGEAPGRDEDLKGEPFVGEAG